MDNEIPDGLVERSPSEENHLLQALRFDGFHKSFSVRIAVWRSCWNLHQLDTVVIQNLFKLGGELRVAVDDHVGRSAEKPIVEGREIKGSLFHEQAIWVGCRTNDVNSASCDLDDKERVDGDKTLSRPHFGCEEIRGCER